MYTIILGINSGCKILTVDERLVIANESVVNAKREWKQCQDEKWEFMNTALKLDAKLQRAKQALED